MRIGICSDIHVHRHDQAEAIRELICHINQTPDLDLLICAGDLSHRSHEVREFLEAVTVDCPRCWVPGNHDIWVVDPECEQDTAEYRYRELFPRLSREAGWQYLPLGPAILPRHDLAVVGTIGWFTGEGYSEWFDSVASEQDQALAEGFARELEEAIAATNDTSSLILVSHHVSDRMCLPFGDPCRAEHSAHLADVIARNADRIALAVHGHKHRRYGPRLIGDVWYVAHPFGYPDQHSSPEDGLRVVDLDI